MSLQNEKTLKKHHKSNFIRIINHHPMRNLSYLKRLITISLFIVLTFTFTGCGAPDKAELSTSSKSKSGIALEDFLPQDTLMSFSINTQNQSQRENFFKFLSYFPKEDISKLMEQGITEINNELADSGLSYKEDFQPIISNNFIAIIGLSGNLDQDDPDIYLAFTIADLEKANIVLDLIAEDPNVQTGDLWGYKIIDDETEDMFIALYKDTILVTNIKENRDEAVKRMKDNQESLLSNENYKQTLKSIETPNLGIGYLNIDQLFTSIQDLESTDKTKETTPDENFLNTLLAETFVLIAKEEGLQMSIHVAFNDKKSKFNLADLPYENPYMYKELPGDKLMMYAEAYSLKKMIELQVDMLLTTESDKKDWEDMKKMFKKTVGLNLEQDVLSWMDRGYAISLQRNGSVMPGISIYIDAKSNPKGAKKVVDLIDTSMLQGLEMMKANATKKDIDFDEVLKHENEVFTEPFEFYYGLTANNYFVLSTYTGLDTAWKNEVKLFLNR